MTQNAGRIFRDELPTLIVPHPNSQRERVVIRSKQLSVLAAAGGIFEKVLVLLVIGSDAH